MKNARGESAARPAPAPELAELHVRLAEAEGTLRAIRDGEVDAVVLSGKQGPQVFTLEGAGHAYRLLIESMNEGALTLTADAVILFANQCFAKMVRRPLEQVTGSSIRRFLSAQDRAALRPLLQRTGQSGAKIQVVLKAGDGTQLPVQISIRPLAGPGSGRATIGLVVTDMTEAQRTEELMRALTHRVVQVQEAEREHVSLELHDNITQPLCGILFRCQALVDELSAGAGPALREAMLLRTMLSDTADEVERIARNLRPGVLDQLGLLAVLHTASTEFSKRTGVAVAITSVQLRERLPAPTELALYRIFQEVLKNVEQHARASHVTVRLTKPGNMVQLTVKDDGVGFSPARHPSRKKGKSGLGLLSMRERASYVGGMVTVKSARRAGTEIDVLIPLSTTDAVV